MCRKIGLIFYFVGSVFSFSQNAKIEGLVFDAAEEKPVEGVTVNILESDILVSSDSDGKFIFEYDDLPLGNQSLVFVKPGYVQYELPVFIVAGKKLLITDNIELLITSDERKIRNTSRKIEGKIAIPKKWYKNKSKKGQDPAYSYEPLPIKAPEELVKEEDKPIPTPPVKKFTPLQWKYAEILEVPPERINNLKLYKFIDEWMGTPYLLSGNNKKGIDCSSFTLTLFGEVYGHYNIGRTAKQQLKEAENRNKAFGNPQYLEEGDLIFFGNPGENNYNINHVGVYLGNNKFVNSTSRKGPSAVSGVKISDLTDPFWRQRIRGFGRW